MTLPTSQIEQGKSEVGAQCVGGSLQETDSEYLDEGQRNKGVL